jgi:hypothetical protein
MSIQNERMARVEERLDKLEVCVEKMDGKLDELLALRNKGAGVFWLASSLFGTGIFGFLWFLFGGK